jgi:hypothetical protein
LAAAVLCASLTAQAQFARAPEPLPVAMTAPSQAANAGDYRLDAARHLYAIYPAQVLHGMVPPLVHAIVVTETEVDAQGKVLQVRVLRAPAAASNVTPWVVALIRKASPLPPPAHIGRVKVVETWLVDRSGQFQVRTLTEGQR